jgi:pimeloyl-ACP methyl ester carboxylesterase
MHKHQSLLQLSCCDYQSDHHHCLLTNISLHAQNETRQGPRNGKVVTMHTSLVFWTSGALLVSLSLATQPFHEWNHGRIQLKDVSIHFRYSASGKPPLLLIHGFPEHSPTWTHIGPILAEQYTVIAPDNRGMGESTLANNDNYTAAAGGEDHIALLNFLNVKQAYVFAHDKGVGLAASLALEHPDRIAKLVLQLAACLFCSSGSRTVLHSRSREGDVGLVLLACFLLGQQCVLERSPRIVHPLHHQTRFPEGRLELLRRCIRRRKALHLSTERVETADAASGHGRRGFTCARECAAFVVRRRCRRLDDVYYSKSRALDRRCYELTCQVPRLMHIRATRIPQLLRIACCNSSRAIWACRTSTWNGWIIRLPCLALSGRWM